ncbi:hypothetical protein HPB49_009259 [Dermacentor silvarum]|uniref:Uncharacterized protein n=1 Tax=Dermacentor silvarum TaxID=543639 RepID=A0ACB8DC30_DERSI|nr:hypothetical protein HPB49_009259 [Dermacentor silvarum]
MSVHFADPGQWARQRHSDNAAHESFPVFRPGCGRTVAITATTGSLLDVMSVSDAIERLGFTNIIIVSTPNQDHADKYQCIKTIKFNGKEYEVGAYETAPDVTAKGVIRGVPVEVSPRDITASIITPRNRTAIAAKRLGNTTTVIILFEGYKVPSYVNYGGPEDKLCAGCGKTNPEQDHTCQPRCQLCGMDHHTADKTWKAKFKKPYIVKHREWLRQQQAFKQQEEQQQQLRFADGPTERGRFSPGRREVIQEIKMEEDNTPRPPKRKATRDTAMVQTQNFNQAISDQQKAAKEQAEATSNRSLAISVILSRLDKMEANMAEINTRITELIPRRTPSPPINNTPVISSAGNLQNLQAAGNSSSPNIVLRAPSFLPPPSAVTPPRRPGCSRFRRASRKEEEILVVGASLVPSPEYGAVLL